MNKILISKLITGLLLISAITLAQQQSQPVDSLQPYREFVSLGKWYLNMPLQIKAHFANSTTPLVRAQDNMEADILLYYGKNVFYMQTGEMEQIVNDSLTILVNKEAKMIKLFYNQNPLAKTMEHIIPAFVPDSSLQKLSLQYIIEIKQKEKEIKEMIVQSRIKISGTDFNKESISITYQSASHQPLNYTRLKRTLLPIDSAVYVQMEADPIYAGRMVKTKTAKGNLFFVMKEKKTECQFGLISHQERIPPALQQQRVVRMENGEYMPAKGFEAYLVSAEGIK